MTRDEYAAKSTYTGHIPSSWGAVLVFVLWVACYAAIGYWVWDVVTYLHRVHAAIQKIEAQ